MKLKSKTIDRINNTYKYVRANVEENTKIAETKLSDIDFMSRYIWIINKDKIRQTLKLNKTQLAIEDKINELKNGGTPPRIVILKARQEGVTTYFQGKMMADSSQNQDRNSLIVAHEQDSTNAIFAKSKFMYENLNDNVKPLQRASNARELIFNTPRNYQGNEKGLNSKIVVKIAGKESIGRGDTYSYVHMSEYAFWKGSNDNSPSNQLTAIMQAVPENINTIAIIESTAKGYNDFKDVWDKAVAGENGWTPLFFPWFFMDEYSKEFSSEEKKSFILSMDEYEKDIKDRFNLTLEQLNWYRYTKKVKCNNNPDKMKQENPSFPEEAFIFSGKPVFNTNKVMARINVLLKQYKLLWQGKFEYTWNDEENKDYIIDSSIKFVAKINRNVEGEKLENIVIYEEPKKGYPYCIGADTKGEGKDYYTATVIDNISKKQVAVMRMKINNSKPFTHQLYCLGKYYNDALIAIEINFNTAPVEELERLKYFKMYQREKYDDFTGRYEKKYGWKTDGTTRPLIIDKEIDLIESNIDKIVHIDTLREMLTFVEDDNGRPDAMSGKHDDLLFSDMIARETSRQQITYIG